MKDYRRKILQHMITRNQQCKQAASVLCFLAEFSNPVWKFDYTFSRKYPSRNKFINADRIDELNQQLISQTDGTYWKAYIPSITANYKTSTALYHEIRI